MAKAMLKRKVLWMKEQVIKEQVNDPTISHFCKNLEIKASLF